MLPYQDPRFIDSAREGDGIRQAAADQLSTAEARFSALYVPRALLKLLEVIQEKSLSIEEIEQLTRENLEKAPDLVVESVSVSLSPGQVLGVDRRREGLAEDGFKGDGFNVGERGKLEVRVVISSAILTDGVWLDLPANGEGDRSSHSASLSCSALVQLSEEVTRGGRS